MDEAGEHVGTVHSLWADSDGGQLEFLGVKTGWLFGSNHVVPTEKAQVDEATRTIKVPYATTLIKDAPAIDADATISDEEETEIYRYYSIHHADDTATTTRAVGTGQAEAGIATAAAATATGTTEHATPTPVTATNVATTDSASTVRATEGADDREIALHEEQVKVGKRTVNAGAVRLRKIVRTEIVNQPVEVRREDVVVERVPADQVDAGAASSSFEEETINVPLTHEEAVVSKEAHVTGAVRVNKTAIAETENVSETVRKEDVEVLRDGKTVTERDERTSR